MQAASMQGSLGAAQLGRQLQQAFGEGVDGEGSQQGLVQVKDQGDFAGVHQLLQQVRIVAAAGVGQNELVVRQPCAHTRSRHGHRSGKLCRTRAQPRMQLWELEGMRRTGGMHGGGCKGRGMQGGLALSLLQHRPSSCDEALHGCCVI